LALPAHVPVELCPKCLLKTGLGDGAAATVTSAPATGRPDVGEELGHYRLVRLLGAGGMGAVYEADDLESDRRVALKILSQRFDSPAARQRFLREGRLAASINHPNSVYVFGTEEIGGVPVIAMELMPGGTLEERVRREGPLAIRAAVDAALHIIDGLEAAHAAGILHRDIKPSNCFLDADGTVKIGDFGLSISTEAHGDTRVTATESFLGTPAFASPEQLRGDELTVRSDIYSVGVTLFYLLTGRLPHESDDLVRLLAKVLENPAPSPAQYRPDTPARLCEAVRRCLEKCPSDRCGNYDQLRRELVRFSSSGTKPATPAARFAAGALDFAIVGLPLLLVGRAIPGPGRHWLIALLVSLLQVVFAVITGVCYFALLEWRRGRTPGKALLRLRVVDHAGQPPDAFRALVRAAVFVVLPVTVALTAHPPVGMESLKETHTTATIWGHAVPVTHTQYTCQPDWTGPTWPYWVGVTLLLFASARRRNGYAALQDWVTDTRVVASAAPITRSALKSAELPAPAAGQPKIGPFHLLDTIAGADDWLTGYDSRLLRRIWIHQVPVGTRAVAKSLRNLGRPGRLRWIAGKRSPTENWDAYEGLTGQPLLQAIRQPQPWSVVRFWLFDLATEIRESLQDGTLPGTLSLDRVWITGEGRAKLFDMPVPGFSSPDTSSADAESGPPATWTMAQNFLAEVGACVLANRPAPLHVVEFFQELPILSGADDAVQALAAFLKLTPSVSRARRCGLAVAAAAGPALAGLAAIFGYGASLDVALCVVGVALVAGVAFPALLASAVAGGGLLLRLFGVAVVDRQGQPASLAERTRRSLIAWLPCLLAPLVVALLASCVSTVLAFAVVFTLLSALAAVSAAWPARSLPDRLAGTCLVPR
jgi:uncharacterized RDD family membrane protein YckC